MTELKIRAGGETKTLYGVLKKVTRGGTTYEPSESLWNQATSGRCFRFYRSTDGSSQYYALPLLTAGHGKTFPELSISMAVGDIYFKHNSRNSTRSLACRVDGQTLYACNDSRSIAVGDTLTWVSESSYTGLETIILGETLFHEGSLNVACKYYDANNNEITTATGYTKPTISMYQNNHQIDTDTAQSAIPSFEVRVSGNTTYWYEINNGTYKKWDDLSVTMPCSAQFRLQNLDSRIKKIKATYTWAWS